MSNPQLGYACINTKLAGEAIVVNRTMVKKTFLAKGITYASELALKNVIDLAKVIQWNVDHEISLYRMSSDMFPWMSEYELSDLPDFEAICSTLAQVGKAIARHNHRLTFHPGPFNVLASPNDAVVQKTIKELRQHGEIMDLLHLPRSTFSKINIHIGGAYGDKGAAIDRFIHNFKQLPPTAATRLTVENDDKANMFSVKELMAVHAAIRIPIVFDYLHHQFCTGGLSEEKAFHLAYSTWPTDVIPVVHYSSAKKQHEDPKATEAAHADFVYHDVNCYGMPLGIMLEAKAKEAALLAYRKSFLEIPV